MLGKIAGVWAGLLNWDPLYHGIISDDPYSVVLVYLKESSTAAKACASVAVSFL